MNVYVFIPIWVGLMAFIAANSPTLFKKKTVLGTEVNQINLFFAIITFLPIFLTVSLGDKLGDVWSYTSGFNSLVPDFSAINWEEKGPGFTVIEIIIKKLFGNNETAFRVIIALIQSIPIVLIFRYYSSEYVTSIFLFVATASYTGWMMNGLRQFTACAIIFAATPLLFKKKYMRLIAIILLAATIHNSALIMLPIIFIVQGQAWNKRTVLFIILAIGAMFVFSNFTGVFDSAAESVGYDTSFIKEGGDTGTGFMRVLVNSVPAIIAFVFRKKIDTDNIVMNVCINMSVITAGLYFISMVTSGILIGRLPGYTSLYNMILLPYLVKNIFNEKDARTIYILMIVLYCIYYYYQMHIVDGLI